jgi:hypothetical protein
MAANNARLISIIMIVTLIIIVSGISPAYSEVSFKDYETLKNTKEFRLFIAGVGEGAGWSNVLLESRGSKKLFCQPGNLNLSADDLLDVVKREVNANAKVFKSDTPLGLILIKGLMDIYPCK